MEHLKSGAALLFVLFACCGCTADHDQVNNPAYGEWLVVGNDLGSRNEFIDQGNVVTLTDSLLTVYSVLYENHVGQYSLRDSTVFRTERDGWRITQPAEDSLIVTDSLGGNRYYLHRLRAYSADSLPARLTAQPLHLRRGSFVSELVLEGGAEARNCYGGRHERDFRGRTEIYRPRDGFWLLNTRFSQPILVWSDGDLDLNLLLVDRLDREGISGDYARTNVPTGLLPTPRLTFADPYTPPAPATWAATVDRLDVAATAATLHTPLDSVQYWRSASTAARIEETNAVDAAEVADVRLELTAGDYLLRAGDRNLRAGTYTLHPAAPYLVLDGGCDNANYLRLLPTDPEHLVVALPVTVFRHGTVPRFRPGPHGETLRAAMLHYPNELRLRIPLRAPADPR